MNCFGTRPPPTPHQKPGISAKPTSPPPGTNKTIPTTHSTNATTPTTPPKEEGKKSLNVVFHVFRKIALRLF